MGQSTYSYESSGVDVGANTQWVRRIQAAMAGTHGPAVLSKPGGFAGLFRLDVDKGQGGNRHRPILVACADGVGTKVLLGIKANRLCGLGIDLVAMNVNDLITGGAVPLFFLDYLAVHKLEPKSLLEVIEGIAQGCRQAGCALLGGETAEMPDLYRRGDFDLAGFAVGVVQQRRAIDGSKIKPGDVLIGLPSSGVHSNGYSLVRRVISARRLKLQKRYDELGETLAEAVLKPTKIYVRPILDLLEAPNTRAAVVGMAHITGGGLCENVARVLPRGCDVLIETKRWQPPPIFPFLAKFGVRRSEMFKVFNMGVGYVLIVRPRSIKGVMKRLEQCDAAPVEIGVVGRGSGKVRLR